MYQESTLTKLRKRRALHVLERDTNLILEGCREVEGVS